MSITTPQPETLALALSGGGSRAMAFHLGCLRGLKAEGLLDKVTALSAVSGGSIVAALYCSWPGSFEMFEAEVESVLRKGFVRPALHAAFATPEGAKALLFAVLLGLDRVVALLARLLLRLVPTMSRPQWRWLKESFVPRRCSRTTILRCAFDKMLRGRTFADLRVDRPKLIVIACDLSARSAFYFARDGVGSWRRGKMDGGAVKLSQAVSASAAFPALLPALDEQMSFDKGRARVILTDGGVYDNLGLAPFWPDRQPDISLHVGSYDRVIACRAGYGLRLSFASAFFPSRMLAVIDSIHARAQNAGVQRLHDFLAAGRFKGILLPFLDQDDRLLAHPPHDLVTRADVADYPTDFSAMRSDWIDRLSLRGEQVTRALVRQYWSEASGPALGDQTQI